ADPFDPVAHNVLGMALKARGAFDAAVGHYQTAIEIRPRYAEAYNNLAVAQRMLGRLDDAAANCRKALELQPEFVAALNNLGNTLTQLDQAEEAVGCFQELLQLQPDLPAAHNNLGLALANLDRQDEERDCYQRAIELAPGFAEAHHNLGNVLRRMHRLDDAVRHFHQALRHRPLFAAAQASLGQTLADQGKMGDAVAYYQQALTLHPHHAEAHLGLGNALKALDRLDEAIASYERAIRANPANVKALANLGNALDQKGELDAARACYQEVRRRRPDEPLWELRIASLCPILFDDRSAMDGYLEQLQQTTRSLAAAPLQLQLDTVLPLTSPAPYNLQFFAGNLRPVKEAYAAVFANRFPVHPPKPATGRPRIGFAVFGRSDTIFLRSMAGVVDALAGADCDCFVFCTPGSERRLTTGLQNDAIGVVPLPSGLDGMAERIREAKLDLLYHWETGTGTACYLLPFLKLAPMQCTSWGTQVTSGIPQVDVYLSSDRIEGDDAQDHYSEQLVCLDSLLSYHPAIERTGTPRTRADFALRDDQHVYLCPQHLGKLHPDFDPMLAEILRTDSQGLLILIQDRRGVFFPRLKARFARTMPDVAERIVFVPFLQRDLYLDLVAVSDVLLDPLHFSGANTSYDGFAAGKAIVTLPSPYQRGRYTLGCYRQMGLGEGIVSTAEQYVATAVEIARNEALRNDLEQRIRAASHQLFEDRQVVREHVRVLSELAERARAG
ncbi:MAG: tetratricopeptide repeat protein, partial [Pirellulales bacterium]